MLKHEGFREEREVRIAFSPLPHSEEFLLACATDGTAPLVEKPIRLRVRKGSPVPYMEFSCGEFGDLPIKRIIVGPGRHKDQTARALERSSLVKKIPISVCATPLV